MVKLCLCMIVGNEEKIIERCIESALPVIDAISICANGKDNTPEIIRKFAAKVPTNVALHTWTNFGHNRTLSYQEAQRYCTQTLGWNPKESYCLFLDADMKLVVKPKFDKSSLNDGGYRMVQFNTSMRYHNLRLARLDYPWKCVGCTHEYWDGGEGCHTSNYDYLEIDDLGDGGSKADKFIRDERLLTADLVENPTNPRSMFYLAQTKECLNKNEEAIEWYQKRIKAGGWFEEVWYAHYMIAKCYQKLGQKDKAVHWFLEAYNNRPGRAEAMYELAKQYREEGKNELAIFFAKRALATPMTKDLLFIHHSVYEYLPHLEISICGYYTGAKKEAFISSEFLLRKRGVDQTTHDIVTRNLSFYVPKISTVRTVPLRNELDTTQWGITNPSLVPWGEGYLLNVRHVNYEITAADKFIPRQGAPTVITRNFLHHLDAALNITKTVELQDDLTAYAGRYIQGLEDLRLFVWGGELYGMPNSTYFTPVQQMNLVKINQDTGALERRFHLDYDHNPQACQKNWLPLVESTTGDKLKVLYSHDPHTLLEVTKTGTVTVLSKEEPKYNCKSFRGSAAPIPYGSGYLGIVHDVFFPGGKRHYYTRFVWYDEQFKVTKVSLPFYWFIQGIEYVLTLAWNKGQTGLLVGVSVREEKAYLMEVDPKTVESLPNLHVTTGKIMA